MYQVLYNSNHSPLEIAKWLNDELALGNKFIACNGDFYIFEAVEQQRAADFPLAPGKYERCESCGTPLRVVFDPSANR